MGLMHTSEAVGSFQAAAYLVGLSGLTIAGEVTSPFAIPLLGGAVGFTGYGGYESYEATESFENAFD
jgi:hypothetical protein